MDIKFVRKILISLSLINIKEFQEQLDRLTKGLIYLESL